MTVNRGAHSVRIEELAQVVGTTVRNIRVYQEKGLLPAPVRRGRTALYGPEHRRRLEIILRLLDRGYTFATMGELLAAEVAGLSISDLIEADSAKAIRKLTGRKRRYSRADMQALAGFAFSDRLIEVSAASGLYSPHSAEDGYQADAYMFEFLRDLLGIGVEPEEIEGIAEVIFEAQQQAVRMLDVVMDAMARSGLDETRIEVKTLDFVPRASTVMRLIFRNAAYKRIREQARLRQRHPVTGL